MVQDLKPARGRVCDLHEYRPQSFEYERRPTTRSLCCLCKPEDFHSVSFERSMGSGLRVEVLVHHAL